MLDFNWDRIKIFGSLVNAVSRTNFGFALILVAAVSNAQQADVFDMSLDQLLEVEVSVASVRSENILLTPAVVSRIEVSALKSMGIHSLEEMISMLPGAQVQDTAIGTKAIMLRGLFEAFNQKVLFQLDGVPYWQGSHGDIPLLGVPLESISHIEVIRGPGTVFHGSNASAGVINVVTKSSQNSSLFATASSSNELGIEFYSGAEVADGTLSIAAHRRDGPDYNAFFNFRPVPSFYPEGTPSEGSIDKDQDSWSVLLKWQKNDLVLQYHEFRSSVDGLAAVAAITNLSQMEQEGRLLHIQNSWLYESGKLEVYGDYNNFFLRIPTANIFNGREDGVQNFGSGDDNTRVRFGSKFIGQWDEANEYVLGVEVEERNTGTYRNSDALTGETRVITMPADDTLEWALYGQWLKDIDQHRLTLGFRYVDNDKSGDNFLPRASWVYGFDEFSSLKLIYSTGFNSPNFLQSGVDIPPNVIKGNPDLKAERVDTVDLAYTYNKDNALLIVNAFYLEASDFIQRESNDFEVQFANSGNFERYGVEVDFQFVKDAWRLKSNLAYQHKGNDHATDDPGRLFVPKISGAVGLTRQLNEYHSIGGNYQYQSERAAASDAHYLSLQYHYQQPTFDIYLTIQNLLQDDYLVADIQDLNVNRQISSGDEDTSFRLSGRWKW